MLKRPAKSLKTVQDAWGNAMFCPVCQDMCRDVQVDVDPFEVFDLNSFNKHNNILTIDGQIIAYKTEYDAKFTIDCCKNTIISKFSNIKQSNELVTKASAPVFCLSINGHCECSSYSQIEFEFDLVRKIVHIGNFVEEYMSISDEKYNYTMFFDYEDKIIEVARHPIPPRNRLQERVRYSSDIELPFDNYTFDFSNSEHIIKKLKTIYTFI